jgi:CRP/FNR family transcriptional regulator, cyclic AMP receptor protein
MPWPPAMQTNAPRKDSIKGARQSAVSTGVTMITAGPITTESAPDSSALDQANMSCALLTVFRGKFCDTLLPGRTSLPFKDGDVLYDLGDPSQSMYFIQKGFVKIGTLTPDGREIIYDVRKAGDVIGELCVSQSPRRDRAVALEPGEAIRVSYSDVIATLRSHPDLLVKLLEIFCDCLADAYKQITALTVHDLTSRITQVLLNLGSRLGLPSGDCVQIPAYLTQEEIAEMVGARRERVSTALNSLRRRGLVDYSSRGHLVLNVSALRNLAS